MFSNVLIDCDINNKLGVQHPLNARVDRRVGRTAEIGVDRVHTSSAGTCRESLGRL